MFGAGILDVLDLHIVHHSYNSKPCLSPGQNAPIRYLLSALIFPVGVIWMGICWCITQLIPKHRWSGAKVVSTMGAFLQVGFSTLATSNWGLLETDGPGVLLEILF